MSNYEYFGRLDRKTAVELVRGDTLAANSALSERQKEALYNQYCFGEKPADLAAAYGISTATTYRYIREMRGKEETRRDEGMAARSKIVAGDKTNGRLVSTTDQHRFEGTCVIGGKKHSKTFTTTGARKATELWEKWCQDLRDEQEFMNRVERKESKKEVEGPFVPTDEPLENPFEESEVVCGYPGDPIEEIRPVESAHTPDIPVRPWREVAEERQQRIEELEARLAEFEDEERKTRVIQDGVIADTELAEPKLDQWFNSNGAFRVIWTDKPVYVLWAKSESPRLYGVYRTMEDALKEVDRLNEVAAFLGSEGAFEVEEVQWRM